MSLVPRVWAARGPYLPCVSRGWGLPSVQDDATARSGDADRLRRVWARGVSENHRLSPRWRSGAGESRGDSTAASSTDVRVQVLSHLLRNLPRRLALLSCLLSTVLFVAACVLPALDFQGHVYSGMFVLYAGWLLPMAGGPPAWYANPLLFFAVLALQAYATGSHRAWAVHALVLGLGALALGATTLLLFSHPLALNPDDRLEKDELSQLLIGCYAWWASLLCVAVGGVTVYFDADYEPIGDFGG
jgi:hypothetical protein